MIAGRKREMGLGPVRHVGLSQARQACYEARAKKRQGIDPLEAHRETKLGTADAKAKTDLRAVRQGLHHRQGTGVAQPGTWQAMGVVRWRPMSIRSSASCRWPISTSTW